MITSASSSSISLFSNIVYPVGHKPIHKAIATLKRFIFDSILDELPAHGVAGVMGRVTLDAG